MAEIYIKVDQSGILSYDEAIEYLHIDKDEELFVGLLNKFRPSIYTFDHVEDHSWFLSAEKLTRKSRFIIEDDSLWIYEDMMHKKLLHSNKKIMPWEECTECYFLKDDIVRLRKDYNNLLKDLFVEYDENIYSKSLKLGLENKALKNQLEQLQANNDELEQKIEALIRKGMACFNSLHS